jgi:hypothetical protein
MWNKEYGVYGYHLYKEGEPVVKSINWDPKAKGSEVVAFVSAKGGGLDGSVAIARDPRSPKDRFIRAYANVHTRDDASKATKARGREIATMRVIAAIQWWTSDTRSAKLPVAEFVSYDDLSAREKKIFEHGKAGK